LPKQLTGPKRRIDEQWTDCPRSQRAKIPNINLDAKDVLNPCEFAGQHGVSLSQLRAIAERDGQTGEPVNDFVLAARRSTAKVLVARKPK
jgi:hypothetical protein